MPLTAPAGRQRGPTPRRCLMPNVRQRYLAYASPLLITELGTHWSDFVMGKRVQSGRATAVLEVPMGLRRVQPRWITASTHAHCSFYRALCCQSWLPAMESELHICHPPPSLRSQRAGTACVFSRPGAKAVSTRGTSRRPVPVAASGRQRGQLSPARAGDMALVSFFCNRSGVTAERGGKAAVQAACKGLSADQLRKWRYECDPTNGQASLSMALQLGRNARLATSLRRGMGVRAAAVLALEAAGWEVRDYSELLASYRRAITRCNRF